MSTTPQAATGYTPLRDRGKKYLITRGILVLVGLVLAVVLGVMLESFWLWLVTTLVVICLVVVFGQPLEWFYRKTGSAKWRKGVVLVGMLVVVVVAVMSWIAKAKEYDAETPQLTHEQAVAVKEVSDMLIEHNFTDVNTDQIHIDPNDPSRGTYTGVVPVDSAGVTVTLDLFKFEGKWHVGCMRNNVMNALPAAIDDPRRIATFRDILNNGGKCRH